MRCIVVILVLLGMLPSAQAQEKREYNYFRLFTTSVEKDESGKKYLSVTVTYPKRIRDIEGIGKKFLKDFSAGLTTAGFMHTAVLKAEKHTLRIRIDMQDPEEYPLVYLERNEDGTSFAYESKETQKFKKKLGSFFVAPSPFVKRPKSAQITDIGPTDFLLKILRKKILIKPQ